MRILVTGIENPFNREIIPQIIKKSDDVDIFITDNIKIPARWEEHYNLITLDIGDIPALKSFLQDNAYDLILHTSYTKYEGKTRPRM